jgi:hypothetical protein
MIEMPHPITEATADVLWNDLLRHGGIYTVPGGRSVNGTLEFDGVVFTVVRTEDVPAELTMLTRLHRKVGRVGKWFR